MLFPCLDFRLQAHCGIFSLFFSDAARCVSERTLTGTQNLKNAVLSEDIPSLLILTVLKRLTSADKARGLL